ncbi:carbohydrate ABC transporter permease [Paenibacillus sp. PL2-23]|uniref:carbohydrate ABC transporter permease n=1 Tax=Paenibacillus sp. PL2-23 TaxID=2100729 RepID=UPI0030FCE9D5
MKQKWSFSSVAFDVFNHTLLILLCLSMLYPFLFLFTMSFSSPESSFATIRLLPEKWTVNNYVKVLTNEFILSGFANTFIRTALGTVLTLIVTVCTAYPLAKRYFPNRNFWTMFVVFTMFFSGGLIPLYLLVKSLGMMNTTWALVLPTLIHTFHMIICRNFFMSLPESLEESAKIDGANEIIILYRIVIPLSMPILATVVLWTAVWHWNAWFDSLIYISDPTNQVLQVVMRRIVLEGTQQMMDMSDPEAYLNPETIKAATVMVTTIPIILFYPFLQKHFVKGILVGSLKG